MVPRLPWSSVLPSLGFRVILGTARGQTKDRDRMEKCDSLPSVFRPGGEKKMYVPVVFLPHLDL